MQDPLQLPASHQLQLLRLLTAPARPPLQSSTATGGEPAAPALTLEPVSFLPVLRLYTGSIPGQAAVRDEAEGLLLEALAGLPGAGGAAEAGVWLYLLPKRVPGSESEDDRCGIHPMSHADNPDKSSMALILFLFNMALFLSSFSALYYFHYGTGT